MPGKCGRYLCACSIGLRALLALAPLMPGAGMVGGVEELRPCALTPSSLSFPASGSSVGGYDDTSSDHSPANAADPPATSANSPATPSPAPTAAGTHASTGNCFSAAALVALTDAAGLCLRKCSRGEKLPTSRVCTSEQPCSGMN